MQGVVHTLTILKLVNKYGLSVFSADVCKEE